MHLFRETLCFHLAVCLLCGLSAQPPVHSQDGSPFTLSDQTAASHIDFKHSDGSTGKYRLYESIAAGLASFDYDLDGRIDVYFLNGTACTGDAAGAEPSNRMYRNWGQFRFEDTTDASGLGSAAFGLGVCVGDINNDGFPDMYITNHGPNELFVNNGDGTFTRLPDQPHLACGDSVGGGCCMLDIDSDGDLEIYAAAYIRFDEKLPGSYFRGRLVYGGPLLFSKVSDQLFENQGDLRFRDISQVAGIDSVEEWGMGTICFDYDQDGDTDIFVANDSTKNTLWQNDGTGKFEDVALLTGIAYDYRGDPQGSMGIDVVDYDGDQWLDLFQTTYNKQLPTLYQNMEGLFFQDVTLSTGVGGGLYYAVNWGTGWGDFDNDGDSDIFIANGHIHDNLDDLDDTVSYRLVNSLLENRGGRKFVDVAAGSGSGLLPKESSRGIVIDDFDDNGRPDVIVLNSRTTPTVIRNDTDSGGHWLELSLVGKSGNRDAVGSQVLVTTRPQNRPATQRREVHSGRGYQSHFGSRLHFGLGTAERVEKLEVRWHAGERQTIENLKVDTHYLVREGEPPVAVEVIP